jgi:hypothetical protein
VYLKQRRLPEYGDDSAPLQHIWDMSTIGWNKMLVIVLKLLFNEGRHVLRYLDNSSAPIKVGYYYRST